MINIADSITLEEFNKRFKKDTQGYIDNATGRTIYCPHDLGFNISQKDCIEVRICEKCWNEVREYLRLKEV